MTGSLRRSSLFDRPAGAIAGCGRPPGPGPGTVPAPGPTPGRTGCPPAASPPRFATGFVLYLVVVVLLPLVLTGGRFLDAELPVLLSFCTLVLAGTRLVQLAVAGRPYLLDISFWCFVYVFQAMAALVQLTEGTFPLRGGPYESGQVFRAQMTILVGVAAYMAGRSLSRPVSSDTSRLRFSVPRARTLGIVGIVAVATTVLAHGFGPFFTSRVALTETYGLGNNAHGGLVQQLASVPVFVAGCILFRRQAWRSMWPLALVLGAANLVVNNPISNARFWFGTVAVGLVAARVRLDTRRSALVAVVGLLMISLFSFSYLDAFRFSSEVAVEQGSTADLLSTSVDYGVFQQEVNAQRYVSDEGHTLGAQSLGAALVWVPRSIWPSKPIDTGDVIGASAEFNVSASLWAEAFVEFGLVGVVAVFLAYGLLTGKVDRTFARGPNEVLAVVVPVAAAFQLFLIRGSLQPAFSSLLPLAVAFGCCIQVRGRVRQRVTRRSGPS